IAGNGSDVLTGPNVPNPWKLLGQNAGKLDDVLSFFGVENLVGGNDNDTFLVGNGATLTGSVSGGGGLQNRLDFSAASQAITINLATSSATGLGSFSGINQFVGGSAADTLVG